MHRVKIKKIIKRREYASLADSKIKLRKIMHILSGLVRNRRSALGTVSDATYCQRMAVDGRKDVDPDLSHQTKVAADIEDP
jgi:hypothetical protein